VDASILFPELLAVPPGAYGAYVSQKYVRGGVHVRRSMRRALIVNVTWRRTAGLVGLSQTEVKLPRRIMVRADGTPLSKAKRKVRIPRAWAKSDPYGVIVRAKTVGRIGRGEFDLAADYLANAWRCHRVQVSQLEPGRLRVRGVIRDPLAEPTSLVPTGEPPDDLDRWSIGLDEWGEQVSARSSGVSGVQVAGLAGYGKTSLLNARITATTGTAAVQFVIIDGKGGPDYDDIAPRCWLFGKDDPQQARDILAQVHALMVERQRSIKAVLGVKNMWHVGPSESWPLVLLIIDEAHTFFHETKGDKAAVALTAENTRFVEELVRKGRNVGIQVVLATQKATGDAIPTKIRDNCQVAISFAQRTNEAAIAALGSDITEYPDAHPRKLQDPAYIGVASMVIEGKPGFTRVRTPYVSDEDTAAVVEQTAHLRADPAALLSTAQSARVVIPPQRAGLDSTAETT
jgi:S-DNA-T family DNA segregation ATPase FtsK/SpoIIIE